MNRTYAAPSPALQGELIASRIEKFQSAEVWIGRPKQMMFGVEV